MLSLFRRILNRREIRHLIAIDIGSNAAIRSLAFTQAGADRVAMRKNSFELPRRKREADLMQPIGEYLHRLISQYVKDAGRTPERIIIGLGSRFTFNEITAAAGVRNNSREPIRPREFQALMDKFIDEHAKKTVGGNDYALAHLMPFRIAVDGYRIDDLTGRTSGRAVEVDLFATYARNEYWENLCKLRSIWGGIPVEFVSNQAAVAAALISILGIRDALLVKIGAKITEVSLLAGGAIVFTGQFENGGDDVTRVIGERLGIDEAVAERIKRQWESTLLPEKTRSILAGAIGDAAEKWTKELVSLLRGENRFLLPDRIYLLGGGSKLEPLCEILRARPWYTDLTFLERVDVQRLNAENFSTLVFKNATPPLQGPEETALAALAARLVNSNAA